MFELKRLQEMLGENGLDAILLADGFNVAYAIDMFDRIHHELDDCPLLLVVPAKGEPFSIAGRHFAQLLVQTVFEKDMYRILRKARSYDEVAKTLVRALKEHDLGRGRLGIERMRLPALHALTLRDELPELELVDAAWIMKQMRSVKSEEQLALMRRAIECAETAWHRVCEQARADSTRRELRRIIETTAVEYGCEMAPTPVFWRPEVPAEPDKREGLDASLILRQHWCGSVLDEPIGADKTFECDLCLRYQGYWADIMLRLCVGTPEKEVVETIVEHRRVQDELIQTIRPGLPAMEVFENLRTITKEVVGDKYGPDPLLYIHGVGIEPHEEPFLTNEFPGEVERNRITMERGTVFVCECEFGVIWYENMFLVTEDGVERLNTKSNLQEGPDLVPKR